MMKLLTINQLSEIINVKKKTLYDWTYKGQLPYIKLGRLLRFDLAEIETWLKRRKFLTKNRT